MALPIAIDNLILGIRNLATGTSHNPLINQGIAASLAPGFRLFIGGASKEEAEANAQHAAGVAAEWIVGISLLWVRGDNGNGAQQGSSKPALPSRCPVSPAQETPSPGLPPYRGGAVSPPPQPPGAAGSVGVQRVQVPEPVPGQRMMVPQASMEGALEALPSRGGMVFSQAIGGPLENQPIPSSGGGGPGSSGGMSGSGGGGGFGGSGGPSSGGPPSGGPVGPSGGSNVGAFGSLPDGFDPDEGFGSFDAFKSAFGAAGSGHAWHHIVEQTINKGKFAAELLHNPANLLKLPHGEGSIHGKISGYYSSKPDWTGGLTVREWLSKKSFSEQFEFGINTIKQFGGGKYLPPPLQ